MKDFYFRFKLLDFDIDYNKRFDYGFEIELQIGTIQTHNFVGCLLCAGFLQKRKYEEFDFLYIKGIIRWVRCYKMDKRKKKDESNIR